MAPAAAIGPDRTGTDHAAAADLDMSDLDRVRWRCRRGLLELDLILNEFAREHLHTMSGAELEGLHRLLDAADNDLWDWISGRAEPPDRTLSGLIARLREVRCFASAR